MSENIYPPSIEGAPPELTVPNAAYRRQVVLVLISLAVFLLFYFGLVIGSGWAVVYSLMTALNPTPDENGHTDSGTYYTVAFLAGILFVFLVKAFFKWNKEDNKTHIEITEREYPELFQFIRRVCEDTRAPFPYRVFLSPDVNASVFYNSSILSLILPVKKNLLIGLGLVNGLNLSEFKAVLAHEFGHFSQSSMRLGSYVYMANHIIYDLVYQRDAFDDLLAKAKRWNIRFAIFAYLIYFVLWVLRKILQGAFQLINFVQSALSRQMEFHADLVAVSVTGSDALPHALKKLEFTNACLMQALADLKTASEHKLYTEDIYYHQTRAAEYLRRTLKEPEAGLVPALPADPKQILQLFTKDEDAKEGGMWASHPSHYAREQNAKRHYIRSIEDERSPWLLFRNAASLRHRMTERFYRNVLDLKTLAFTPVEEVQTFIDSEHAETAQDDRYLGMYDGRPLSIPPDQLTIYANDPAVAAMPQDQIETLLGTLYNARYKGWMETHAKRIQDARQLNALERGEVKLKGGQFEFRGNRYKKPELKSLLQQVEKELEADADWLQQFDRQVFQTHLRMAQIVNEGDKDLFARYEFHLVLQEMLRVAYQEEQRLVRLFQYLGTKESGLSKAEFQQVRTVLAEAQENVQTAFRKTRSITIPSLQNMRVGMPLSDYLLEEPLVNPIPAGDTIDGHWSSALGRQTSQIEERTRRLFFKSMGAILARQETIAKKYRDGVRHTSPEFHFDISPPQLPDVID